MIIAASVEAGSNLICRCAVLHSFRGFWAGGGSMEAFVPVCPHPLEAIAPGILLQLPAQGVRLVKRSVEAMKKICVRCCASAHVKSSWIDRGSVRVDGLSVSIERCLLEPRLSTADNPAPYVLDRDGRHSR